MPLGKRKHIATTTTAKKDQEDDDDNSSGSGSENEEVTKPTITCLENPPISEILWNFIIVNYEHLQSEDTKRQATNVCKVILKTLKSEKIPKPSAAASGAGEEQESKYKEVYSKYSKLVATEDDDEEASKLNVVDIFGRSLLEKQFDHLFQVVTKEYIFKDFSSESVFELLKKELDDSTSIIFRPDFNDLYSGVGNNPNGDQSKQQQFKKSGKAPSNSTNRKEQNSSNNNSNNNSQASTATTGGDERCSRIVMVTTSAQPLGPDLSGSSSSGDSSKKGNELNALRFEIVFNDGSVDSLQKLLAAKNIYGKQLPKMPKDYIARLVFDRSHRSIVGTQNGQVVGGISFRPFFPQGFSEIAFCAITGNEQVKGYGTKLMNHLKDYCQSIGCYRFLTYADNFAIGYFKKQGFTKDISLDEKRYKGYIKDYDGGTLMECVIRSDINYLDVPNMIVLQKHALQQRLKEIAQSERVYPGLKLFKDGGRVNGPEDVPGLQEIGYQQETRSRDQKLHSAFVEVLEKLKKHEHAWPFLDPVDPDEVPDYYEVIKQPIDLLTIEQRLKKDYYRTKDIFVSDVRLIFENCRTYNSEHTEYFSAANKLEEYFKTIMAKILQKN